MTTILIISNGRTVESLTGELPEIWPIACVRCKAWPEASVEFQESRHDRATWIAVTFVALTVWVSGVVLAGWWIFSKLI